MRQFRFIFVSILTSLFVINAVFWRKAIAVVLCGLLSFNSASCYRLLNEGAIVNAVAPRSISNISSNLLNVPAPISNISPETQKKLILSTTPSKPHRPVDHEIKNVTLPSRLSLDLNKALEQIEALIISTQKFQLLIVNQTPYTLSRVGSYHDLSNWPLINVPSSTAQYRDWTENGGGYFSFAANYAIGDTGKYFQFAASWPFVVSRKINLCTFNESGNTPAKNCWKAMNDSNDKNETNGKLTGKAIIAKTKNDRVQWIYQVTERKEQSDIEKPSNDSLRAYAEAYIKDWGTHPQNGSLPKVSPISSLTIERTNYPDFPYSGTVTTEAYPTLGFLFYYGKNGWITNEERIRIQEK